MTRRQTILLVEGMKPAEERLARVLNAAGYHAIPVRTRKTALAKAAESRPLMIIVDTPSLRFNGLRFCETLLEARYGVPVLILLPPGASLLEDIPGVRTCLSYPFSSEQLIDTVSGVLANMLQAGDLIFNVAQGKLAYREDQRSLTPKQARLLEVFMRHPGQVLTRAFLMRHVWNTDYMGDTRTLDVHVRLLRKAIEREPNAPQYLRTVRGVGYRFDAHTEE